MSLRSRIAFVLPLLLYASPSHAAWTAGGNVVCNANLVQSNPTVVGDGAGGAYVVWRDNRPTTQADVYVQHLDTNGNVVAGWPANGLQIEALTTTNNFPTSVSDGAGGVIAVWQDGRGGLYAQKVNSAGATQWTANGVRIANVMISNFEAIADGSGGVIVAWEDSRNVNAAGGGARATTSS